MNPFLKQLKSFPGFFWGFVRSPKRLRNMAARLSETLVALGVVYLLGFTWLAVGLAFLAEFVWYEFFLEPAGLAGHYFERGARDGESFRYE